MESPESCSSTTERPQCKPLDLHNPSFQNLIEQLPASFPAEQSMYHSKHPSKFNMPFILRWEHNLLLVEVTAEDWVAYLKSICSSIWNEKPEDGQYKLRLDEMVTVMYQCLDRSTLVDKTVLYDAWIDMKFTLLLWALDYRARNMMKSYVMTYPTACIGEPVVMKYSSSSAKVHGHLCKWSPQEVGQWDGEIAIAGQIEVVKFSTDRLINEPGCLLFDGDIGKLHQTLVQATATSEAEAEEQHTKTKKRTTS